MAWVLLGVGNLCCLVLIDLVGLISLRVNWFGLRVFGVWYFCYGFVCCWVVSFFSCSCLCWCCILIVGWCLVCWFGYLAIGFGFGIIWLSTLVCLRLLWVMGFGCFGAS